MTGHRPYAVIEAPSILGLKPTGVERLAESLLDHGLAERIHARRAGRLDPPAFEADRDRETQILNARTIADWTPHLADAIELALDGGEFPVVLGGDCSIVLGAMLALRRRGRAGLLFIDGHADFYQPEADPHGEAASMDLALVTGFGPTLLTNLEGCAPLVRAQDVVLFGYRDADDQRAYGSQPLPRELRAIDLATIRDQGIERAANAAVEHLGRDELDGFFIHLDADCLDDAIMPAVDYRLPDGLRRDELEFVLRAALATRRALGIEITIYNPHLDPDGSAGQLLVDLLANALGAAAFASDPGDQQHRGAVRQGV